MAKAKKSAKEASSIFHNIIQASVGNKQYSAGTPGVCPQCGKNSNLISPAKKINEEQVESTFKCPNGHVFTMVLPIK
jgi:hypothetical protein